MAEQYFAPGVSPDVRRLAMAGQWTAAEQAEVELIHHGPVERITPTILSECGECPFDQVDLEAIQNAQRAGDWY